MLIPFSDIICRQEREIGRNFSGIATSNSLTKTARILIYICRKFLRGASWKPPPLPNPAAKKNSLSKKVMMIREAEGFMRLRSII